MTKDYLFFSRPIPKKDKPHEKSNDCLCYCIKISKLDRICRNRELIQPLPEIKTNSKKFCHVDLNNSLLVDTTRQRDNVVEIERGIRGVYFWDLDQGELIRRIERTDYLRADFETWNGVSLINPHNS